tara:strand:+ start:8933 stop:9040 length:108 start_codon:yes stop_codon:yes gene_type:complete
MILKVKKEALQWVAYITLAVIANGVAAGLAYLLMG